MSAENGADERRENHDRFEREAKYTGWIDSRVGWPRARPRFRQSRCPAHRARSFAWLCLKRLNMPETVTQETRRMLLMTAVGYADDRRAVKDSLTGYAQLAAQRVAGGWHAYLVTLMFSRLSKECQPALPQMFDEAGRVYRTFVTRVVRRPLSSQSVDLPVMIAAPDYSVGKSDKPVAQIALNGGLHLHAILLVPPRSRLRIPVDEHFRQQQALYVGDRGRLSTIDVRPIEDTIERAVEYVLKSLPRRRFTTDDVLVLPRALSEMRE